jgi:hypothetical protein
MSQVIVILDSNTLSVVDWYFADSPIVPVTPGIRLEVPEGLTVTTLMAVRDADGTVTLQEDPDKLAQKTQAQWTQVRSQQRDLLYKSDWTCSVTDYEVPNKSEWVQYRAALRDVTRGSAPSGTEGSLAQSDPFNIVWPSPPVAN